VLKSVHLVVISIIKATTYPPRDPSFLVSKMCFMHSEMQDFLSTTLEKVRFLDENSLFRLTCIGHRPDLSSLSSRERFRSKNNATGLGIGSQGPLGRLLIRGEPGHDIVQELYPIEDEPIIDKPGRGAFVHTDFELLLRIKGIKNLVIAGVTTDVCVSTTMREANDRGFDCVLLEDGTAASEPSLHIGACESIKMEGGIFGATAKLDDIIEAVENFKHMTVRSVTKSERVQSPSLPHSPTTPAPMMSQSMSTPLSAPISSHIPLSAGPIGTTYIPQHLEGELH
jgi:nicotinamidase-related amidase